MVSSIGGSNSDYIQQLMAQMMKNMSAADTDGTAGLSKTELSSIDTGSDKGGAGFIKALNAKFDKIDSDTNGQISQEEIVAVKPSRPPMGPPPGLSIEDLFTSSDTDGTAGLSKDELATADKTADNGVGNFIEKMTANFDSIDTNKDGQISPEEIEAARPQGSPLTAKSEQGQTTADNASSDNNSSNFGEKMSNLSDFLFKQLLNAYKENAEGINASLKDGLSAGVQSALSISA